MSVWPRVPLGEIFEIARGGSPRPIDAYITDADDGINWISIADASDSSKYIERTKRRIRPEGVARSRMVVPGDFLLTNSMSFGRPYIMRTTGCIHDGWLVLGKKRENIDPNFFYRLLGSETVYAAFARLAAGATVKNLNIDVVKGIPVPVPPLPEQRRIAAILDQADALRAKRREALAQLDSLVQSIFIEMFGDPVENSKCWPTIRLGDHTAKMGSGATPTGGDAAYKTSGISLIRSLNVRDGVFAYKDLAYIDDAQAAKLSNVVVCAGDVLLNITGASVARVCRAPMDVLPARVNQHVMVIRPKSTVDGVFLERMLLSRNMKRLLLQIGGSGATREAITKAQASELTVICPPLALQQTFATRIQAVEALKTTHRAALAESNALFASLQHRAFAGQLSAGQRPTAFATIAPCAPPTP